MKVRGSFATCTSTCPAAGVGRIPETPSRLRDLPWSPDSSPSSKASMERLPVVASFASACPRRTTCIRKRFAHLFKDPIDTRRLEMIQSIADRNVEQQFGPRSRGSTCASPLPLRSILVRALPIRRGLGTEHPGVCRSSSAVQPGVRGREHPAVALPRGRRQHEGAWREIMRNNPMPAVMGRACYHTCEGACNRARG